MDSLKLDIYGNDLTVGKLFILRRSAGENTYVKATLNPSVHDEHDLELCKKTTADVVVYGADHFDDISSIG